MAINNETERWFRRATLTGGAGALVTADQEALAVEAGRLFDVRGSATVANGEPLEMILSTGGLPSAVLSVQVTAQASSVLLEFYEGAVFTGGSEFFPLNLNREVFSDIGNGGNNIRYFNEPPDLSISDTGTLLTAVNYVGAENGGNVGDFVEGFSDGPFILLRDTNYLIRVIPGGTGSHEATFHLRTIDSPSLI